MIMFVFNVLCSLAAIYFGLLFIMIAINCVLWVIGELSEMPVIGPLFSVVFVLFVGVIILCGPLFIFHICTK